PLASGSHCLFSKYTHVLGSREQVEKLMITYFSRKESPQSSLRYTLKASRQHSGKCQNRYKRL
ncbi:MAG: hypothetical protein NWE83_09065, partial [Candidatus Bathyarchaeota archaeon]|nr:hypothetical protein [Candidatus Bathyarchaeota archaeon]